MKKIIIILALMFATLHGKAQQQYDTMYYFPPEMLGCNMISDSGADWRFQGFFYVLENLQYCPNSIVNQNYIWDGPFTSNGYYPEAFAQPYHFDSTVLVCGVRAKVAGNMAPNPQYRFNLMDSTLSNSLASSVICVSYPPNPPSPFHPYNLIRYNYFFDSAAIVPIKDFFITADIPYVSGGFGYDCTCSIYDTCVGNVLGCQFNETPWFKKNGKWYPFAGDTIYHIFQKTHFDFLPILLIPRITDTIGDSNSLSKINIDNTCNVYPNPAIDKLNIISQFKVKNAEIYNIAGIKVKEITIMTHEAIIDISDLKQGSYIIKLYTTRGIATKKIVISEKH